MLKNNTQQEWVLESLISLSHSRTWRQGGLDVKLKSEKRTAIKTFQV